MFNLLQRNIIFLIVISFISNACVDSKDNNESDNSVLSAKTLIKEQGAFKYENGTYASSCYDYYQSPAYNGEGDGEYWLDPDLSGELEPVKAICDMTTNGGGWTLIINRSAGTMNKESCGENLNEFFQNQCGDVLSAYYNGSYNIGSATVRKSIISEGDWRFHSYDIDGQLQQNEAYIIHNDGSDLFPDSVGEVNNIKVDSICDFEDLNCDITDVIFKWVGDRFFNIALCSSDYFNGDRLPDLMGVYGYCHDGLIGTANSLFGSRPGYSSLKVWGHQSPARLYEEKIWVR